MTADLPSWRILAAILAELAVTLRRPAAMVGWLILLAAAGWASAEPFVEVLR